MKPQNFSGIYTPDPQDKGQGRGRKGRWRGKELGGEGRGGDGRGKGKGKEGKGGEGNGRGRGGDEGEVEIEMCPPTFLNVDAPLEERNLDAVGHMHRAVFRHETQKSQADNVGLRTERTFLFLFGVSHASVQSFMHAMPCDISIHNITHRTGFGT